MQVRHAPRDRPLLPGVWRRARHRQWAAVAAAVLAAVLIPACSSAPPAARAPRPAGGLPTATAGPAPDAGIRFPLHVKGASIVDARGKPVKLAMVNWYGAESPDFVVGGLAYQPIGTIIREIVSMGFNGVRLPWSNQMWQQDPPVPARLVAANPRFAGERARTVFEQVVRDLAGAGLMIVLDNHNSDAEWCCSTSDGNTLWYTPRYPQSAWVADWKSVAAQFAGIPQVIGADLRNEPRGRAAWGGPPSVDWQAAAELGGDAVQSVAPAMLIFVEGVQSATDLSGVAGLPVRLRIPGHVVYEVHDYAAEQRRVASYDAWVARIQPLWGYLVGRYPLWVGEFGTCNDAGSCVDSASPAGSGLWFSVMTRYLRYHNLGWSYWPLNGTKSDGLAWQGRVYGTPEYFGVLNTAWDGPSRPSLLARLQTIQPPCRAGPLADGSYHIVSAGGGGVIGIAGARTADGTGLDLQRASPAASQRWEVTSLGCSVYSIISAADGKSVDVYGQSIRSGARVDQWSYSGKGNQQFVVKRSSRGYYTFASINSMVPVQVPRSATGAWLRQSGTGGPNRQWSFRPA
jgi:endoglucanase